jgi:menaquinone-specific isochorismate synthase
LTLNIHQFLSTGFLFQSGFQLPSETFWIGWKNTNHPLDFRVHQPKSGCVSIFAPDFFLEDPKPWWCFSEYLRVNRTDLIQELKSFLLNESSSSEDLNFFPPSPNGVTQPSFDQFSKTFHELQNEFQVGNLIKAVPVVFETSQLDLTLRVRAQLLLQLLMRTQEAPVYPYGVWSQDEGVLGATPELLFSQESSDSLRTVALAGTRLNGSSSLPLLEDPKELQEHQIVIAGIQESLKSFGTIHVGPTQELHLPTLSHLMTPIQLQIDSCQALSQNLPQQPSHESLFENWVNPLHPTPALGAFPKRAGWEWLKGYQKRVDRKRHGAPWGMQGIEGETTCVVGIRNLQWHGSTLFIGAGCGLIAASHLEKEWLEIHGKIRSIKKLFGWESV